MDVIHSCNSCKSINGLRDRKQITTSLGAEGLDKILNPFIINSEKLGIKGTHLNVIKAVYDRLTQREKTETISPKTWNRKGSKSLTVANPVLEEQ